METHEKMPGDGHAECKSVTAQPVEKPKLLLGDLSEKEEAYIESCLSLAAELFKKLDLMPDSHLFSPSNIDRAVELWFENDFEKALTINASMYADILACAWGQYLADALGMKWHVITDSYGTEIGLYHNGQGDAKDIMLFPFSSLAKAFCKRNFALIRVTTNMTKEIIHNGQTKKGNEALFSE